MRSLNQVSRRRSGVRVKKKTAAGGVWKAFVRMKTLGQKGSANFKTLSEDLAQARAQGSAEWEEAKARGELVTGAARAVKGLTGKNISFGLKTQQTRAAHWQRTCAAYHIHTKDETPLARALHLTEEGPIQGPPPCPTAVASLATSLQQRQGRQEVCLHVCMMYGSPTDPPTMKSGGASLLSWKARLTGSMWRCCEETETLKTPLNSRALSRKPHPVSTPTNNAVQRGNAGNLDDLGLGQVGVV